MLMLKVFTKSNKLISKNNMQIKTTSLIRGRQAVEKPSTAYLFLFIYQNNKTTLLPNLV